MPGQVFDRSDIRRKCRAVIDIDCACIFLFGLADKMNFLLLACKFHFFAGMIGFAVSMNPGGLIQNNSGAAAGKNIDTIKAGVFAGQCHRKDAYSLKLWQMMNDTQI